MESNKTKKRKIVAIDFSKDKQRALKILKDEKEARDAIRRRDKLGIKTKIPKKIDEFLSSDVA